MAISKVADRATANSNSTVTTVDLVLSGLTVDNFLIIRTAADNSGGGGGARSITVTNQSGTAIDAAGAFKAQRNCDPGAASAGTTANLIVAKITATSGTVRLTYGGAVVQACVAEEWSGINVTTPVVGGAARANNEGVNSTNLAVLAVSSGVLSVDNVLYCMEAIEGPSGDTITGDSDTSDGTWSALTKLGTTNATADTNQTVYGQYKTLTGTGAQNYGPTINNARDSAGLAIELASADKKVDAENTTGTGVANNATSDVATSGNLVTATAVGNDAGKTIESTPAEATASATANDATVETVGGDAEAPAESTSGTGTGYDTTSEVDVNAGVSGGGSSLAWDAFNRSNRLLVGDTLDSGQTWERFGVTSEWDIDTNRATYVPGAGNQFLTVTGITDTDVDVTADVYVVTSGQAGLTVRYSGLWDNWQDRDGWVLDYDQANGLLRLREYTDDSFTTRDSYAVVLTVGTWHTLRFVVNGTQLDGYLDGVSRVTYTSSTHQSNSHHGLFSAATAQSYLDNFTLGGIAATSMVGEGFDAIPKIESTIEASAASAMANDATVETTGGDTNAQAQLAAVSGAAHDINSKLDASTDAAAVTVTGNDTGATIASTIEAIAANATANDSSITVEADVESTSATGTSYDATIETESSEKSVYPGAATGTAVTNDPTTTIESVVEGSTGIGAAYDATVLTGADTNVDAGLATATGLANNTDGIELEVGPGTSSGSGAAAGPGSEIEVGVDAATVTGEANQATVSTEAVTYAMAGAATATGDAHGLTATISTVIPSAEATGTANTPSAALDTSTGVGLGSGSAEGTQGSVSAGAQPAIGSGVDYDPSQAIMVIALLAMGAGVANNARINPYVEFTIDISGCEPPTTAVGCEPATVIGGCEEGA